MTGVSGVTSGSETVYYSEDLIYGQIKVAQV